MSYTLKTWLIRNRFQLVILTIIIIVIYQCISYFQLDQLQQKRYQNVEHSSNLFICTGNGKSISADKVNDDYCDCDDGSDEPQTNACMNGRFVCTSQQLVTGFRRIIPSGWVNDGICDCCDGSDEWQNRHVIKSLDHSLQVRNHRYLVPCPKIC